MLRGILHADQDCIARIGERMKGGSDVQLIFLRRREQRIHHPPGHGDVHVLACFAGFADMDDQVPIHSRYSNILTGLCTPEELRHWTDAARRLEADYHLPVGRTAMHTDIPGLSWIVVSALADAGVRPALVRALEKA